jgi:hypothetical protein
MTTTMSTPPQDLSILHRMFEVEHRFVNISLVNIIQASIELPPEQKSQLATLKLGETLTAPRGYTVTRRR